MSIEAPLSFGQLYSWREVGSYPPAGLATANLPATADLRGLPLDRVEAALRRLLQRHEPLRTTFQLRDGVPVQQIHDDVALPIEQVDRPVAGPPDAEATTEALLDVALSMTGGLCWRGVLVTTDGAPQFLSLSFSHLVFDVWSIHELATQFGALLMDPSSPEPGGGPSPREIAGEQQDETWQARQQVAQRYWRRVLDDDLVHRLPVLADGEQRNRIQATLHSYRLAGLAERAARAHGVTPPAVLMALFAAALGDHLGASRLAVSLMSSNRFTPERRHIIGTSNQLIPVVATVDPAAPLAEHITRSHWAAARGYRNSCYDLDRITAMAGGPDFNTLFPCWFNYLQFDHEQPDPADDRPAELVWTPLARQFGQPVDVRVTAKDGRTSVALRTDPGLIDASALTRILRSIVVGVERAASGWSGLLGQLAQAADQEIAATLFPAPALV